mmetsp:Transcript_23143/g.54723  ORF Transcript_23143/g.54723 Transcript_23143/m.54723 type:complete len:380 (+) Transcript_23143:179-1318(+)|eukprot:CAMPEP_0197183258 /NCGR_PEP_ID=MMETSP1423-20130617/7720_1 /TAXON_ID=476441 /ORGANISM="Pseudo-nitzschia heimii, Strain UNC1101" /LENGTH=379 /DNA_ID=CAMNT_0042633819 /DNA_START=121 /DNA_END=1260 /DNA_ORIENTATION=+
MADEEDFIDEDDIVMVDSEDEIEDIEDDDVDDDGEDHMNVGNDGEIDGSIGAATAPVQEEDSAVARRRAIQGIMRDNTLSDQEKRMRIQNLMSGGRTQIAPAPPPIMPHQEDTKCTHYERNCNIIAPCCNRIVGCRICHDETSPPGHPPMNRFMVREVVCKLCGTRQHASNQCINCKVIFGEYHCSKCNLWMSQSKKPFHCDQCGFCRVGGQENFRHCSECCMCISVNVFETHRCFKDKYKNNCPVCREDMFSSRQSPQDLPCGHAIHAHCFRKLAGFDYRCPICKKTVVSQQSMAAAWEARARDIAEHPMPSDLQRVVDIMCNDCERKCFAQKWHFLGIQCSHCDSFNTVVEQVLSSGPPGGEDGQANRQDENPSGSA